jgi:uncharacterized protein (DUF4415 family)
MNAKSTRRKTGIKITDETREAYERRNRELDNDPDAPTLPLEKWARGEIGKFYRPRKTAVAVRLDNDVLAWLKSGGDEGYTTRINQILRREMLAEAAGKK